MKLLAGNGSARLNAFFCTIMIALGWSAMTAMTQGQLWGDDGVKKGVSNVVAGENFAADNAGSVTVYIGTYTRGSKSKGIYQLSLDMESGKLTLKGVTGNIVNPSFLAIHPNKKYLYAVNESATTAGKRGGAVTAFAINATDGSLKMLNQHSSGGGGPCHLVVDHSGKNVLVANYGGGSVAVLPIQKNGKLSKASCFIQHKGSGKIPGRQSAPHAHSINVDANNRFAVVADLGMDKVLVYKFDAETGTLTANDPDGVSTAPGAGPRHFAFHPNGKFAYVINEITLTVTAFAYDAQKGTLTPLQTITTLPKIFKGRGLSTAEVQVHPSGKFLYGSNRGHDSIAMFRINQKTGKLKIIGHQPTGGKTPRNFGIDPSGKFLLAANQSSDSIHVFRIDGQTGKLKPTGHSIDIPRPVCVKFLVR
ncbi:MAG: lactonase family protein [Planctomycetaceae bacterium]